MDADTVLGTCHHDCPDTCGWVATVEAGVAVKLRGNPEHPYPAASCARRSTATSTGCISPDRILYAAGPHRPQGEGRFERATWDEALALVSRPPPLDHRPARGEAILPWWDAGTQG